MFRTIYHLLFGKRFEFYTAYSVPEAISRVRALNHEGYGTLKGKQVNSRSATITPDHYFQCQQNFGENMDVFCKGIGIDDRTDDDKCQGKRDHLFK